MARLQVAARDSAIYNSTRWVRVHLVAAEFDQRTTTRFDQRSRRFDDVPLDVPFTLSFEGLATDSSKILWRGIQSGRTAASAGASVTADVAVVPVHDATLASLAVPAGLALIPTFSSQVKTYTTTVPAGTSTFSLATTGADTTNTITCNGGSCTSVTLPKDTTAIVVRNIYGDTLSYSVSVRREPAVAAAVARDSTLSALTTNPGSMAYDKTRRRFVDSVATWTSKVAVSATASVPSDVSGITYNGLALDTITLAASDPTLILVQVTNLNGHTLTDTLEVWHRPDAVKPALTISSPAAGTSVPYATNSILVQASADDAGGIDSIRIGDKTCLGATCTLTVSLVVGANDVKVQAWDKSRNTDTASVTITRGGDIAPPSLSRSSGTSDKSVPYAIATATVDASSGQWVGRYRGQRAVCRLDEPHVPLRFGARHPEPGAS